jgi:hypothetical protein
LSSIIVRQITYRDVPLRHGPIIDVIPASTTVEDGIMLNLKLIVAAAMLALFAASASAHDYVKRGYSVSNAEQWDTSLAAPFARDQNDRFGQ